MKKRGLGKDFSELMDALSNREIPQNFSVVSLDEFRKLPIEYLKPGIFQPRKEMNEEALQELAESVKAQGIIQPIIVRCVGQNGYEIIAGERRWRAAQKAGLNEVPVLVKDISDSLALAIALIENIQRENLNPIEEAVALERLIKEFDMTHAEIAKSLGKSRAGVTNLLRLLGLSEGVKDLMEKGLLEMGHARALLSLDKKTQIDTAELIVSRGLSVRETENLVKRLLNPYVRSQTTLSPDIKRLQNILSEKLGAKVFVQYNARGKGKIVIQYNSLDELDGILNILDN